jgi:quinoprotein glucose dehydrogenase
MLHFLALALALVVTVSGCQAASPPAAAPRAFTPEPADSEWPAYGGTYASARYSPLDQITRDNVKQLRVAWRWRSPDHDVMERNPGIETYVNEGTPLMIRGVLYVSTSLSQVAAIDTATGRTVWVYDPKVWTLGSPSNLGWVHRGVAYWTDGREERIFIGTGNGYLIGSRIPGRLPTMCGANGPLTLWPSPSLLPQTRPSMSTRGWPRLSVMRRGARPAISAGIHCASPSSGS